MKDYDILEMYPYYSLDWVFWLILNRLLIHSGLLLKKLNCRTRFFGDAAGIFTAIKAD